GRYVFPVLTHRTAAGGTFVNFSRPMFETDFAQFLAARPFVTACLNPVRATRLPIVKLMICFSALPLGCCSLGQVVATTLNAIVYAGRPPVYPWLDNDQGLKVKGGFKVDDVILSKHMPLVSQDFADKAVILQNFQLDFEHAVSGTSDPAGNDQFVLELTLILGGNTVSQLKLALSGSTKPIPPNPPLNTPGNTALVANPNAGAEPQNVPPDSVFWINIQKSIGPIHIGRIGFNCVGDDLQILLDAGLATSSFSVELSGLSATAPIFGLDSIDDIKMDLKGLDVAFSTSALSIEGGLLHSEVNGRAEYDGVLMIKTADFTVTALGSFTSIESNGHTENSLFGFAFLAHEIGGPPAFFVTGLSAGFGYNRSVKVPTIAEVGTFPLLAGLNDPAQLGLSGSGLPAASQLASVLAKVNSFIQPDLG